MANPVQSSQPYKSKRTMYVSRGDDLTTPSDRSLWLAFALMVTFFTIAPIWVYPIFSTVCVTLSATVGTPSMRTPPDFFGIGTPFTGGGK